LTEKKGNYWGGVRKRLVQGARYGVDGIGKKEKKKEPELKTKQQTNEAIANKMHASNTKEDGSGALSSWLTRLGGTF